MRVSARHLPAGRADGGGGRDVINDRRAELLQYADLAPSAFRLIEQGIEVRPPAGRNASLAAGAAIANLRVAAAHFGYASTVTYVHDSALIALRESSDTDASLRELFPAIPLRRTNREPFEKREIDPDALERVCDVVDSSDYLHFLVPHDRPHVAELVEQGDLELLANDAWRDQLAPTLNRNIDAAPIRARRDRELTENAAGIILVTSSDDAPSLLRAGETLELLLLLLTSLDIQYAFLNQPIQVPPLRRELWRLARTPTPPQLMLRIGYAPPARRPAAPRRPVETVLR